MAWRFSARVRRGREAPCREAAMRRSKNGEPRASVSSHSWRSREALHHGSLLYAPGIKKGADPAPNGGGTGPKWCRYAAARRTVMPILHAIITIFGIRTMQLQWGMVGGGSGDGVARQGPRVAMTRSAVP